MKRSSTGGQKRGEEEDTNFASGEFVDHILRISHDKNHGRDDGHRQHRLPRHRDSATLSLFFFFFQSQNKRQIPNASNTKQLPRGSEARRPQRASERGSEGRKAVVMPIPKP